MLPSILLLMKFLALYFLLFFLVPSAVLRWQPHMGWLDRFFISFIHVHLLTILSVHSLVALRLYELFSFLFVLLVAYLVYLRYGGENRQVFSQQQFVVSVFQILEKRDSWRDWLKDLSAYLLLKIRRVARFMTQHIRKHPISFAVLLLLFSASIYIRFLHSIEHLYFASSDPYVHLKWAKLLKNNEIYVDGVYPYGFEAIISTMHVLFNLDPYISTRFLGPLSGVFIVLGIYYIGRKYFPDNYLFAIFAVLLYFISSFQFGFLWRQLSSLSMEYGAMFILPAIHFLINYVKNKKVHDLILSLECFLLILLIHPYAAICLFISYSIILLLYIRSFSLFSFIKTAGCFIGAGILGVTPMMVGMMAGIPFHGSSIDFVRDSVQANEPSFHMFTWGDFLSLNPHLLAFYLVLLILSIFLVFHRRKVQSIQDADFRPFLLISFVLALLYMAEDVGLPSIMMAYRLEVFLVILTSVSISFLLVLFNSFPYRRLFQLMAIGGLCSYFIVNIDHFELPEGDQYQYDEAVATYLKIKRELPLQDWTIISPIEEYPFNIGYGWHYNLSDLIMNLSEGNELLFPTTDVFIFIENLPLGTDSTIQTDQITDLTLPKVNDSLDYYTEPEYRKLLQEKALYWIESVREHHEDLLTIYTQTNHMTIYRIHQNPVQPYDLSKFKR